MNPMRQKLSDFTLIKALMENARVPISELARRFGVSDTAIRKRLKKLERDGVIVRYTVEVDPKKLGFNVVAIIGIDTMPEDLLPTISKLKEMDEVIKLYTATGDHMILIECWLRDSKELERFLKKLENMKGVKYVRPAIILERIK